MTLGIPPFVFWSTMVSKGTNPLGYNLLDRRTFLGVYEKTKKPIFQLTHANHDDGNLQWLQIWF